MRNGGDALFGRLIVFGFLGSLYLGGVAVLSVGSRTPTLLYGDIFLGLLAYCYFIRLIMKDRAVIADRTMLMLGVLYILAQMISLFVNESDMYKGILSIKTFASGLLAYFIVLSLCRTNRDIDWITYGLVLFAAGMSVMLIVVYALGFSRFYELNKSMIELGFGASNYLASFLVMLMPVCIGLIISERQWGAKIFFGICSGLMVFSLFITMSRGAMLSLVIVFGILLPLMTPIKAKVKYIAVISASIICMYYMVPKVLPEFFITENAAMIEYRVKNPDYSRIRVMRLAWEDFLDRPLTGIGPYESYALTSRYENMPHNFIFQTLADLGVMGGIPFMAIIGVLVFRAYKVRNIDGPDGKWGREGVFVFAGLAGTLVHGMMEITFQGPQYTIVFWIFMATIYMKTRASALPAAVSCGTADAAAYVLPAGNSVRMGMTR